MRKFMGIFAKCGNALVTIDVVLVSWLCCDPRAPQVVITSDSRSISQAFWGAEQAKDDEGGVEASTMQETIIRLENEVSR